MGKYLRKAKVSGEVAVMEVSHHSSLGVRTRARSLAAATAQDSSRAYLELPNRRLEKPLSPHPSCNPSKEASKPNPSPKPDPRASMQKPGPDPRVDLRSPGSVSTSRCSAVAADTEVSFSETVLESGARDRWVLLKFWVKNEPFCLLFFPLNFHLFILSAIFLESSFEVRT
ncbi:cyclin-dependent kinase inhibitor [Musa troglodytarum]|uniref:Cyclin-dependent kinase inhibitor n=1 Tax=Musa troglodytarum TaxID=320322 RepID=A0A9E7ETC6_9LILI|nr:cyclin-dependent kinase inhibitor [Musa troglodytarum]